MNRLILSKIEELKYKLNDEYTSTTSDTNNNATKTYNTISNVTQEVTTIKNKIGVLSDMFTDLRVLNGTAKNVINLSTVPVIENNGIRISNDKFELDTSIKNRKEISVKDSSISSLEKYTLTTSDNKKTDIDSFLKTAIDTTITFPTTRYTFNLNLRYTSLEQINSIEIQLGLLTESYPLINSIKYIDKDNIEQTAIILNNTSTNYDLDYYREVDNKYVIDISSILTDQIIIEFTSKTSSSITLKDIKTYFKREVETGEIILGPIHTNTPLLKVALDTEDISTGASFEFSTDLEYWLKLDSSSIITSDTNTKILSFNTVNAKSIKTNEDIYTFYIKINLTSSILTNEDSTVDIYNTVREDNSLNNDVLETIEDNLFSVYKVKNSDFIHGDYQFIDNLNIKDFNVKCLEYIEVNGVSKVIGLVETPYSVSSTTTINNGGIGAELKLKRLNANTVSSCVNYDLANAKVYDIYPRDIEETINTRQKDNLCFYLKREKVKEETEVIPPIEEDFSAPYDLQGTVVESIPTLRTFVEKINRFDPTYWRVDGPSSASFSIVSIDNGFEVNFESRLENDFVGIVWDTVDDKDHSLIKYNTNYDYSNVVWSFDLELSDTMPLITNEQLAPTLTIEYLDNLGRKGIGYVALFNYVTNTVGRTYSITLDFNTIKAGFNADVILNVNHITKMYLGAYTTDYSKNNTPLAQTKSGYLRVLNSIVTGTNSQLDLNRVEVSENSIGMCTSYDDHYDLNPQRLVNNFKALGYSGFINHYCGMSHYPVINWNTELNRFYIPDTLVTDEKVVNTPTIKWHEAYSRILNQNNFEPVFSVSWELYSLGAREEWCQREFNDRLGKTGYEPPSYFLSLLILMV